MPGEHVSERWAKWRDDVSLEEYHERWTRREAEGQSTHGEADLIVHYGPASVLDAGCGMGRVAIELARRGLDVAGADLDADLLEYARRDAPHVEWHHADLAAIDLGRTFELVAMPGNVMLFCDPTARGPIVAALTRHLEPGDFSSPGSGSIRRPGDSPSTSTTTTARQRASCCTRGSRRGSATSSPRCTPTR